MILLVTQSSRAHECAEAMRRTVHEEVIVTDSLGKAANLLRAESYLAVVLDLCMLETEPHESDTVTQLLGTAIPVYVNLAISGLDRLVREVRSAVLRRKREEQAARLAALGALHHELNDTITSLILSCELALETPGLPAQAVDRLQAAHELVRKLKDQLEGQAVTVP